MRQTARDWLLARHADATGQLDSIRRGALVQPGIPGVRDWIAAIFVRPRIAWTAMAAAWAVIAFLHFTAPVETSWPGKAQAVARPNLAIEGIVVVDNDESIPNLAPRL